MFICAIRDQIMMVISWGIVGQVHSLVHLPLLWGKMDEEKGRRRSRGLSGLEKCLIFLFVAMTGACIGLVVVYFIEKADSSTHAEGECVYLENILYLSPAQSWLHVIPFQNKAEMPTKNIFKKNKTCCNSLKISLKISEVCLLLSAYVLLRWDNNQ